MNVVITGATKGLGRAIATLLFDHGASLAICSRHQEDLDDMKQSLLETAQSGQTIIAYRCDVSKRDEIDGFGRLILSKWNHIDVLINNAGVFMPGALIDEEDGQLQMMMDTNLYSAYHLTRTLLPVFVGQQKGHIFNMCSVASIKAYPNGGSYCISKFALLGFTKVLREELKAQGIKVTALLPGATWSDSWSGIDLPEERLMQAHDIAIAVWQALQMSPAAVVEEIIIRPQLGDL